MKTRLSASLLAFAAVALSGSAMAAVVALDENVPRAPALEDGWGFTPTQFEIAPALEPALFDKGIEIRFRRTPDALVPVYEIHASRDYNIRTSFDESESVVDDTGPVMAGTAFMLTNQKDHAVKWREDDWRGSGDAPVAVKVINPTAFNLLVSERFRRARDAL